jgi:tetratricopeptide (TPR) repeat protein
MEILAVAVDGQGPERPRVYVEKAKASYRTAVDKDNTLSNLYGFKYVPVGILVDEDGRLAAGPFKIDVGNPEVVAGLQGWLRNGSLPEAWSGLKGGSSKASLEKSPDAEEAQARFQLGSILLKRGREEEATAQWKRALELDSGNWLIRKQIWAVENPDRFYQEKIDFAWQKEKLAAGG